MSDRQTIAAVATPSGPGAVGIVRLSGPHCARITHAVAGKLPPPRTAVLLDLRDPDGVLLDRGLVLHFPGPASYTGEDVTEFQTHGSPVVLAALLRALFSHGAVAARAGEFTERAFLNGKLDLLQAEAVADLVSASTEAALRSANLAMAGHFSRALRSLAGQLIEARALLEAGIDFGDEASVNETHRLEHLHARTTKLRAEIEALLHAARQGALLSRHQQVVLVGQPNAGKSTLMNALSGTARAIVSDQPGTTRDVLTVEISLAGMHVTLLDTAGLHEVKDEVEQEGVRRALAALTESDLVLLVYDATAGRPELASLGPAVERARERVLYVRNKTDLLGEYPGDPAAETTACEVSLSAREGHGLDQLRSKIVHSLGRRSEAEAPLLARERHLRALTEASALLDFVDPGEFAADEVETAERLRLAHRALLEMTGEFTSEDLLGEIFGRFCIGK